MMAHIHSLLSQIAIVEFSPVAHNLGAMVLAASLKSLPILVAAAGLSVCLRRSPAAARHMVWLVAIAGLFFLPLFSLWQPRLPKPIQRPLTLSSPFTVPMPARPEMFAESPSAPVGNQTPQGPFKPAGDWRTGAAREVVIVVTAPREPQPVVKTAWWRRDLLPHLGAGLFIAWILVAFALILRLVLSLILATRIARSCVDVSDGTFYALVLDAARRLGGAPKVTVRLGRREEVPAVPMTIGFFAPCVLLPRGAAQWPQDRIEAALLHELAHVRRRDWAGQILASLACALYWFNPLVWMAARRLRVESEMACDDQVLVAGASAAEYAGHLLEMARSLSMARPGVPTAVAAVNRPQIEGRLKAILDRARCRGALSPRARAFALAFAVLLLVPLALLRFQSRATAQLRPHAATLDKDISRVAAPAEGLPILHSTKGTSTMLSLKPLVSKASAALASLSLLTTPIPASAQDSAPAAPPAPPAAVQPAPPASGPQESAPTPVAPPTAPPQPGPTARVIAPAPVPPRLGPGAPTAAMPYNVPPQFGPGAPAQPGAVPPQTPALGDIPSLGGLYAARQDWSMPGAVQSVGQNSYDIHVMSGSVVALLAQLCRTAGVDFTISGDITTSGSVTVYRHHVNFVDALQSIVAAADPPWTYSVQNGVYHFKPKAEPGENVDARLPRANVTLDLDNAPFDKALKDLCDGAHASYTIVDNPDGASVIANSASSGGITLASPAAQTSVTVHLHGVSFPAALRALLNATSPALTYGVKDGIIYIRPGAQTGYYSLDFVPQGNVPTTDQTKQWQVQPLQKDQAATDMMIQEGILPRPDNQATDRMMQQGVSLNSSDIPVVGSTIAK